MSYGTPTAAGSYARSHMEIAAYATRIARATTNVTKLGVSATHANAIGDNIYECFLLFLFILDPNDSF